MNFIRPVIVVFVLSIFTFILYHSKPKQWSNIARVDLQASPQQEHKQLHIYYLGKELERADWDEGIDTYAIHSENEKIFFQIRPVSDCNVTILLRGPYETYKDSSHKKLWVKYTSLKINGKEALKNAANVWHDEPYIYTFPVKKGVSYEIEIVHK